MTAEWREFFCVYLNLKKKKNAKKLHCRRLKSGEPHPETHSLCILFVCFFLQMGSPSSPLLSSGCI